VYATAPLPTARLGACLRAAARDAVNWSATIPAGALVSTPAGPAVLADAVPQSANAPPTLDGTVEVCLDYRGGEAFLVVTLDHFPDHGFPAAPAGADLVPVTDLHIIFPPSPMAA
jgi:hypothetical protein